MQSRGYTLVEIVVVIGIASILLAIGTLRFGEYATRYRSEAQTRMIYGELQRARANAVYQRRATRVKLYPSRFEVYSSLADGSGVVPIVAQELRYPVEFSGDDDGGDKVDFDDKGITFDNRLICIDAGTAAGAVDAITIHSMRISIGKKDKGDACETDNVTIR